METIMEQKGDTIPGSRFLRDFCEGCGEPIRVINVATPNYCTECDPAPVREVLHNAHMVGEKLHLGKPAKKRK
jgi:hypothetical protein